MNSVVFIDSCHENMEEAFAAKNFKVVKGYHLSVEELEVPLQKATGIIIRSRFKIDKTFLNKHPNLQFIGRFGAGLENIDLTEAENLGISCYNAPEGNRNAVAEHALGMLLNLVNHIKRADQEVHRGLWKRRENTGFEISNMTVGIIGCGQMGSAFAEKMNLLGAEVLAYDKYVDLSLPYVRQTTLEELIERIDVLSLHLPLNDETKYFFQADLLKKIKKPFWFINTSRGKIAETKAIVYGLKSRKILGAGLDVLEYEKDSFTDAFDHPIQEDLKELLQFDNVITTPHVAGWSKESFEKMGKVLSEKILKNY